MASHEALRKAFKLVGCKNVATALGRSLSLIYQWSRGQNGRSEARNPLDVLLQILRLTGDLRPLEWLCQQVGGRFVQGAELPVLARKSWVQFKAEMEELLKPEGGNRMRENRGCKHRLPGGRCGFPHAARN